MVFMEIVRTPEARFANLDGYLFEPNYENIPDAEGGTLRIHYVDAGPRDGEPPIGAPGRRPESHCTETALSEPRKPA